jgi:diguanylate cyclase (GGDEF)-like protein
MKLPSYEDNLRDILLSQSIDGVDAFSDKLIKDIVDGKSSFVKNNSSNRELRLKNEKLLENFQNRNMLSIYIVILLENQLFFLMDSSQKDKGEFGELFKPEQAEYFIKARESGTKEIAIQKEIADLGFTLIKPILQEGEPPAFLVIDYTQKTYNSLISLLRVSTKTIMLSLAIVIMLLISFILFFLHSAYIKNRLYRNPETGSFYRAFLTDHYEKINFSDYYIALADIDLFKRINDLYGQKNGDMVISAIMKRVTNVLNRDDIFVQYGGEEFLLLISKKDTSDRRFRERLEEIRVLIENLNFRIEESKVKLTISIGAFIESQNAKSLQDSIQKADTALYDAKHSGRNRVSYFDVSKDKKLYREKLKEMIESDKLVCHYQPIMNLETNEVHHYEALLRIETDGKIIFPDKILPELEDSYFYSRISMRVIEFNIRKMRENPKLKVSINLSADDLLNDAILSLLFQNSDLSKRVLIEILENKSIDYEKVEASIQKLKILGYKICIDDFGSGFSNIDHLLNLSIDYLKLDGSIIKNIHNDKKAHSIIEAVTFFCHTNGIEVIAEFVENQEIVDILKGFGIKYGQGYHFDRARPYDEIV